MYVYACVYIHVYIHTSIFQSIFYGPLKHQRVMSGRRNQMFTSDTRLTNYENVQIGKCQVQ